MVSTSDDNDDGYDDKDEVFQWWVLLQWWLLASCFGFRYLSRVDGFDFGFGLDRQ